MLSRIRPECGWSENTVAAIKYHTITTLEPLSVNFKSHQAALLKYENKTNRNNKISQKSLTWRQIHKTNSCGVKLSSTVIGYRDVHLTRQHAPKRRSAKNFSRRYKISSYGMGGGIAISANRCSFQEIESNYSWCGSTRSWTKWRLYIAGRWRILESWCKRNF